MCCMFQPCGNNRIEYWLFTSESASLNQGTQTVLTKTNETGLSLWVLKQHACRLGEREVSDKDSIGLSN